MIICKRLVHPDDHLQLSFGVCCWSYSFIVCPCLLFVFVCCLLCVIICFLSVCHNLLFISVLCCHLLIWKRKITGQSIQKIICKRLVHPDDHCCCCTVPNTLFFLVLTYVKVFEGNSSQNSWGTFTFFSCSIFVRNSKKHLV